MKRGKKEEFAKSGSLYKRTSAFGAHDTNMLFYWLRKQKELFADDLAYVGEIFYAAIDVVSMMNQYNMLSCVIADDELSGILKEIL